MVYWQETRESAEISMSQTCFVFLSWRLRDSFPSCKGMRASFFWVENKYAFWDFPQEYIMCMFICATFHHHTIVYFCYCHWGRSNMYANAMMMLSISEYFMNVKRDASNKLKTCICAISFWRIKNIYLIKMTENLFFRKHAIIFVHYQN